jgi:hypothetical protein
LKVFLFEHAIEGGFTIVKADTESAAIRAIVDDLNDGVDPPAAELEMQLLDAQSNYTLIGADIFANSDVCTLTEED